MCCSCSTRITFLNIIVHNQRRGYLTIIIMNINRSIGGFITVSGRVVILIDYVSTNLSIGLFSCIINCCYGYIYTLLTFGNRYKLSVLSIPDSTQPLIVSIVSPVITRT